MHSKNLTCKEVCVSSRRSRIHVLPTSKEGTQACGLFSSTGWTALAALAVEEGTVSAAWQLFFFWLGLSLHKVKLTVVLQSGVVNHVLCC